MKTILLFFVFTALGIQAQNTYHIDWQIGTVENLTIEVGDKVIWTWQDSNTHTVETVTGSTESFNSQELTGIGQTFEFVFNSIGTTTYICGIHPTMTGVITVQEALSRKEFSLKEIAITPNPVKNILVLSVPNNIKIKTISIYNILGKEILNKSYFNNQIDISGLNSGLYLLKLSSTDAYITKRFIKQ